jgi:hypothetical protein
VLIIEHSAESLLPSRSSVYCGGFRWNDETIVESLVIPSDSGKLQAGALHKKCPEWAIGVGRGNWFHLPPPSEPDLRISRIRLSDRWLTSKRIDEEQRGSIAEHNATTCH